MSDNKDLVREKVIESASHLFAKFGYKKTSMDDIASITRKGKTSLYYYFKNKEDVFQAVIEKEAKILENQLIQALVQVKKPEEKLKAYIKARMKALDTVANFYDALKNELLDHLNFIDATRGKYYKQEYALISSILSEGNKSGVFNIKNIDITSITLLTSLKGLEIPLFIKDDEITREQKIEEFIRLLFEGLLKR